MGQTVSRFLDSDGLLVGLTADEAQDEREALEKLNREANEMKRIEADMLMSAPLCTEAIQ